MPVPTIVAKPALTKKIVPANCFTAQTLLPINLRVRRDCLLLQHQLHRIDQAIDSTNQSINVLHSQARLIAT